MRHRTTVVLLTLFLAGLGVLWWADYAEVLTRDQKAELLNRLLPDLIDVKPDEVVRIEVDRPAGGKRVVVSRAENGQWQMTEPVNVAADGSLVETLARNLANLRRSPDAGTIDKDPKPYGLDTPNATVKVFLKGKTEPAATLDVGNKTKDRLYVRAGGLTGIDVVDPRLLELATEPPVKWRDTVLVRVPSFQVEGITIKEREPARVVALKRDERRWRMVSPVKVPADDDKAEGLVAELSALHVADGTDGFVEDDVRDLAKYGLAEPELTVEVAPFTKLGDPQIVRLGKVVPGKDNQVYAVRGDQNDVVRVEYKRLREAIAGPNDLRSAQVLDFTPQRVDRIRIDAHDKVFDLARTGVGWELLSPVRESADRAAVQTLLSRLAELKTSEFFDPSKVRDPKLDKPEFRVRGWQSEPGKAAASADPAKIPDFEPQFDLSLGRHDLLRKTIFGRIAGDTAVLAIPDKFLEELPKTDFAYRDRSLFEVKPEEFARITVERRGSSVTVEAPKAGAKAVNKWTMSEPVQAPADDEAVTALILTIANLRAESWETDRIADPKVFGFDKPLLRIKWTLQQGPTKGDKSPGGGDTKILRIGKTKPGPKSLYANLEGDSRVFTVNPAVLAPMEAELHSRSALSFDPDKAERLVFQWPTRTLALLNTQPGPGKPRSWQADGGYDTSGFDVASATPFVAVLASLKTPRFLQYQGLIPDSTGLSNPRLLIRVKLAGESAERTLRVGNGLTGDSYVATTVEGNEGEVFMLTVDEAWKALIKTPSRADDLPEDVFTAPE